MMMVEIDVFKLFTDQNIQVLEFQIFDRLGRIAL